MGGAHYIWIECSCGHSARSLLADWPEDQRADVHLKPEVLARLRCSRCGAKPVATICGWTAFAEG